MIISKFLVRQVPFRNVERPRLSWERIIPYPYTNNLQLFPPHLITSNVFQALARSSFILAKSSTRKAINLVQSMSTCHLPLDGFQRRARPINFGVTIVLSVGGLHSHQNPTRLSTLLHHLFISVSLFHRQEHRLTHLCRPGCHPSRRIQNLLSGFLSLKARAARENKQGCDQLRPRSIAASSPIMRLLHTTTFKLHEFFGNQIPYYAILSHRWGIDEVTFQDLQQGGGRSMAGWAKIAGCCAQARKEGWKYAVSSLDETLSRVGNYWVSADGD